jgi:hypothetical protein
VICVGFGNPRITVRRLLAIWAQRIGDGWKQVHWRFSGSAATVSVISAMSLSLIFRYEVKSKHGFHTVAMFLLCSLQKWEGTLTNGEYFVKTFKHLL